jgi:hypothetical protein
MQLACFGCFAHRKIKQLKSMQNLTTGILVLLAAGFLSTNPVFSQEQPDSSRIEQGFKKYRFGGYGDLNYEML